MNNFVRKNLVTILVLGATILLAGIAVFTALRLYQLRQQSVSPAAPTSKPGAQANPACQALSFTLTAPTASPTPTPVPGCYGVCTTPSGQSNCPTGLTCQTVSGSNICVNPSCTSNSNCVCATATPTPTPTPTPGVPNACGGTCGSDANCQSGMTCYITSGTSGVCRNPSCTTSTTCVCATTTPTPTPSTIALATPTPTAVRTAKPQLPQAGVSTPTWLGIGAGAILLIGAILLAL